MERYVLHLALTLLCIYLTLSCSEETKERTISVPHLESQPNNQCPDGTQCPNQRCCPRRRGGYGCCRWGRIANCCPDRITCCPRGWLCLVTERECVQQTYSSVLRVQAAVLVNSTGKRCRDGTAGMDLKSGRSIPSQQVETALKTSGFIGTSGDVSSPVEKYQCPDGTSTCELSSGIDGCCPIQNARWIKIVDTFPRPHSSEDADPEEENRRP
ncbi:granulins-like [Orbicella faveolata]|uniref:granulins-like n=1 Tax=Orbicella faveolata TaxID=48498 RepID=UPI0009E49468|nr:granulins-like [Orbicella faveolata]